MIKTTKEERGKVNIGGNEYIILWIRCKVTPRQVKRITTREKNKYLYVL